MISKPRGSRTITEPEYRANITASPSTFYSADTYSESVKEAVIESLRWVIGESEDYKGLKIEEITIDCIGTDGIERRAPLEAYILEEIVTAWHEKNEGLKVTDELRTTNFVNKVDEILNSYVIPGVTRLWMI